MPAGPFSRKERVEEQINQTRTRAVVDKLRQQNYELPSSNLDVLHVFVEQNLAVDLSALDQRPHVVFLRQGQSDLREVLSLCVRVSGRDGAVGGGQQAKTKVKVTSTAASRGQNDTQTKEGREHPDYVPRLK